MVLGQTLRSKALEYNRKIETGVAFIRTPCSTEAASQCPGNRGMDTKGQIPDYRCKAKERGSIAGWRCGNKAVLFYLCFLNGEGPWCQKAPGKCLGKWDKFLQNLGQIERCGQVCLSGPEEEGDFSFNSPLFQRNSLVCDYLHFRQEGIESRDCGSLCVYEGHTQGICQLLPSRTRRSVYH